jgi:hypothetical protein
VVNVLNGFGVFKVSGNVPCAGAVAIVASSPALTGLTGGPTGTLSNWNCSVHEWFNTWDPSFIPLAVATDIPSPPPNFTAADGTRGHPYILARGDIRPVGDSVDARLKICKVAGPGVAVGTPFSFNTGVGTVSVPAGPAPGGYCVIGPAFPSGTVATITEAIPPGHVVTGIAVAPPTRLVGTPNLPAGQVQVTVGPGVTEVTYRNEKRTGFLEICKRSNVRGNFTFTVSPGPAGPIVVPAGACSPAIEVPAGPVTIQETPTAGVAMAGCATIPGNRQGPCNLGALTSTVTVVAGDVSTQTIAIITNSRTGTHLPSDTAASTGHLPAVHHPAPPPNAPHPDERAPARPALPRRD